MKLIKSFFLICFVAFSAMNLSAQDGMTSLSAQGELPKVFLIGQHEAEFEKLTTSYKESLLSVCDNDMNVAFEKWMGMIEEMEAYSKQIEYDLNGVKAWFHVFWTPDGSIKHIAYYLRPNSKNVDLDEMNAFLTSFMNNYKFPLTSGMQYQHYTGATFPIYYGKATSNN